MPTPKAARTPISAAGRTTPVSTTALATTTCQRRGTAAIVAEIIREPYSRAPAKAPRMPASRTAKSAPVRTVESGSLPLNPGPSCGAVTEPVDTAAEIAPSATSTTTTAPMPIQVLRRLRSLIHSERIARPRV
jgi:hypothetical protein